MKRSQEEKIVLDAIRNIGIEITPEIRNAVSDGLRQIRHEKFEDRMQKKRANKSSGPRPNT